MEWNYSKKKPISDVEDEFFLVLVLRGVSAIHSYIYSCSILLRTCIFNYIVLHRDRFLGDESTIEYYRV